MKNEVKEQYRVCGAYDTETCNIKDGDVWKAFPILYQVNDLRDVDLSQYEPGVSDNINFYTSGSQMVEWIEDCISWGKENGVVPVLCVYNLTFDIQTIAADLPYTHKVLARSGTSVYTWSLYEDDKEVFRFWDVQKLQTGGLAIMGELAGLPKLKGDWDYSLIRIPEKTPLTDEEKAYAARDVQVIPAYLRYLLESNSWLDQSMFGCTVLTSTSMVRQYAKRTIGGLKTGRTTVLRKQSMTCTDNLPKDYDSYAMRAASFRGGFSFTSAATAGVVVHNVASLDVTSMHHTFMPARIPLAFVKASPEDLNEGVRDVLSISRERVLYKYDKPFPCALHAQLEFTNLRLRKDSCFAQWGVALLARAKFAKNVTYNGAEADEAYQEAENALRKGGYRDIASADAVFAFGKLYKASTVRVWVSEIELWCISRVYEWDSVTAIQGEITYLWADAPSFVGLQSQQLYKQKSQVKALTKTYIPGTPYTGEVGNLIPDSLADRLRDGSMTGDELNSYYMFIKGMFNGIYGTQAQNVYKGDFSVDDVLNVVTTPGTTPTPENFKDIEVRSDTVLYTYGLRIVGRSRMHLVLAMELLYESFGKRIAVTGGDTDSVKVRCDSDVANDDLLEALTPLHEAADICISNGYGQQWVSFPGLASHMEGVGHFEVEQCGKAKGEPPCYRYPSHIEFWVKCRVSFDQWNHAHVTCAGLPIPERPAWVSSPDPWNVEELYERLAARDGVDKALTEVIGYNVTIAPRMAHYLQHNSPSRLDFYEGDVTDYLGNTAHVKTRAAIALYSVGRVLGGLDKGDNEQNVAFLRRYYNRYIDVRERTVDVEGVESWEI